MRFVGIDPSTKTGVVALDESGNVLTAKEITGIGKKDPKRVGTLTDNVMTFVKDSGVHVAIEAYAFGSTGQGVSFQYSIGALIRDRLWRRGVEPKEINPHWLKKWLSIDRYEGVPEKQGGEGRKHRKSEDVKLEIISKIHDLYGFKTDSNNIADAYVIAQILRHHVLEIDGFTDDQNDILKQLSGISRIKER